MAVVLSEQLACSLGPRESCSNIRYDKRDAVHGVSYSIGDAEGWTPVIGRKKRSFPCIFLVVEHLLALKLTWRPLVVKVIVTDSSLVIPDHATVKFSIVDGKPGLQVNTRCASSWTHIATRTRAKLKS